ncbi:MAG: hypothetical protein CM15mP73_4110 [Hyphomicrobiales bacterium]|nr:MAG: hypothetical protein CM15mP73_4110 [Hyphomicrobiales bacterium]
MDENINDWISKKITSNDVVLFMKGNPLKHRNAASQVKWCKYSIIWVLNSHQSMFWKINQLEMV